MPTSIIQFLWITSFIIYVFANVYILKELKNMNFKNIFYLGVIAMTLVVFSSCSEDDAPVIDETNLVGTWLFKSVDTGEKLTSAILDAFLENTKISFKSDGTYTGGITSIDFNEEGVQGGSGTWTFENNTLTLGKDTADEEKDEETLEVRELSTTTLVAHRPEGVDGDGDALPAVTFTYSKQ